MDINKLLRKYKDPESKKIHDELFQTTSEYKYYTYGVAHGMYIICNVLNEYNKKEISLTNIELMQVIRSCANMDEKISGHFIRMLKDLEME